MRRDRRVMVALDCLESAISHGDATGASRLEGVARLDATIDEAGSPRARRISSGRRAFPCPHGDGAVTAADSDAEQLFLSNLSLIDRIIGVQVRRHALQQADAEEYASWAKARIIDGDYAILRKFAGRSSLATFLTTVLANLFADFRNNQWGRWRPSASALRFGPVAIRLEQLLYRDGHRLREATEILLASSAGCTERDIARLAAKLPTRGANDEVSLTQILRTEQEAVPGEPDWDLINRLAVRMHGLQENRT